MPYATCDDLMDRFGKTALAQLTNRDVPHGETPDTTILEAALTDATETIDGYAAARYRIPLEPVPAPVRRWCADMAFYYLHGGLNPSESVRKAFEDALAGLKDMAKGMILFQVEGIPTVNTSSDGVCMDVPKRLFTPESLRGF